MMKPQEIAKTMVLPRNKKTNKKDQKTEQKLFPLAWLVNLVVFKLSWLNQQAYKKKKRRDRTKRVRFEGAC